MVLDEESPRNKTADGERNTDASAYDVEAGSRPDQQHDSDDHSSDRENDTIRLIAFHIPLQICFFHYADIRLLPGQPVDE